MKRLIVGLATAALVAGDLGLAAGTAQAAPGFAPLATWCPGTPGDALIADMQKAGWDLSVCHDYYFGPGPNGYTQIFEGDPPPRMCGPVPCGLFP
jgi:hypothetical protein